MRKWPNYIDDPETWSSRCAQDPQWVAECLSRIGRFGGQHPLCSVLSHSLNVFDALSEQPAQVQLWGLYHDAHEILTSDVPRKFKNADLCKFQDYCDALLQEKLGILVTESIVSEMDTETGDREFWCWSDYQGAWSFLTVDRQIEVFVSRSELMKGFLR